MTEGIRVRRLTVGDRRLARTLLGAMAAVFDERRSELGDAYLDGLLGRASLWVLIAEVDGEVAGGLTAHVLPLTREEEAELFVYDVAVLEHQRRRGVGRALLSELRRLGSEAGIRVAFVAADEEDVEAHEFYRALGGSAAAATMFTFRDSS